MSQPSDLRERLARLSPEQRAHLSQRLAEGRDTVPAAGYLAMIPAVPLRMEKSCSPDAPARQVAVYPASHSQRQMWLLHEYAERAPVYVMLSTFHLVGRLDQEVMVEAVADVVRRHGPLRTTFVFEGGQLLQHVVSGAEFTWEAKNFEAVGEAERTPEVERYLQEIAGREFDLASAPGFRVALARLGPEEHVLCFVLHHIISDGWSRSNLWREVGACYTARAAGQNATLPPLPVQFVDYAAWQERQLSGVKFAKQAAYWKAQLAGKLDPLDLPSDRPRPSKESFQGARVGMAIDSHLAARLTALAKEEGSTFFMILLAAFKMLLHRYTGRDDLLVGVPIANRQREEAEGLIACFSNTLVMRTSLSGAPTFRDLLTRVRETAVQAYAHQDMPFERLAEMLHLRRHAGVTPVFQVLFALQDFPAVSLDLPGIRATPWSIDTATAKLDLSVAVQNTHAGWMATAEYSTDLFDADRVEQMLGHWSVILESIASNPGQRVADVAQCEESESALSCVLVGKGNLLIQCGQLLRSSGLSIAGVISNDPLVVRWATEHQIPTIGYSDSMTFLEGRPIDYLFSIYNLRILPVELLRLPRIAAINYHDGPLPRYAGLHAPSWALFNGEKSHGITWHLMDEAIDTGAIVTQRMFEVAAGETALTLNLKCSEAALSAFSKLLPDLARGFCHATPQDHGCRTYYSGVRRPPAGGVIDWSRTGEEIDALVRGLDFGSFSNPLLFPKLWTGTEYLVVSEVRLADVVAEAPPGTVVSADHASLTIATGSRPLTIGGLLTLDGEPVSCFDAVSLHGLCRGSRLRLPEKQQTQRLSSLSELFGRHEPFWERRLRELLPVSIVRVRPVAGSARSGGPQHQVWEVPAELENWLACPTRCYQQGEFLLAAFGCFLARIHFEECFDVEFTDHDVWPDGLPAVFAEKVPFRFQVGEDFKVVFEGVRTEMRIIDRHRGYARDLVTRSAGLRGQAHLMQRNKLPLAVELGGYGDIPCSGHDLVVRIPRGGNGGKAVFSHELFREMPWLMERFADFIRNLIADADMPLGQIALMGEEERNTMLVSWSSTGAADESSDCLHHLFESQAARSPDSVALQQGAVELTYRELDAQADALAARLLRLGLGPDDCVGILLERSPETIIGLLGILKAGGAYVPLDPAHPQHRLDFIVKDSGLKVVVSIRRLAARFPSGPVLHVYLDDADLPVSSASRVELPRVASRNLAYVIYTSGSTGEPKGVMVEHRSVVNFTRAAQTRYELDPADRVLQFASITFDASVEEIFPCLASGGTLVLRTDEMLASPKQFVDQCADWEITVLDLPTAYWHLLVVELIESGGFHCPSLRLVIIGGEVVNPAYVAAWRERIGNAIELVNTYGPTEATIVSTWASLCGVDDTPIGKPIPGAKVYVLDAFGQPLPVGMMGELFIGGAGVARGYLSRPQLTSERFLPDPFDATMGARIYQTGDRCSWRKDGMLEFHGRIDGQVKIRGQRLELGEVEAVLSTHPDIRAATVIVQDGNQGDRSLTAFLVMRHQEEAVSVESVRLWAAKRLPEYMIPQRYLILASLPMTSSGKVDRKALETLDVPEITSGKTYAGPRSHLEAMLADAWQNALRMERVGIDDNFFHLGGHSLLAVAICSKINQLLDLQIPLRWIFDYPTIESLSHQIGSLQSPGISPNSDPILIADRRLPLPMSFGQQGMWLLQQTLPDPSTYNVAVAWAIQGSVDLDRLRRALVVIQSRHEVLRTSLVEEERKLLQRISDPERQPLPWREADLRDLDEAVRSRALEERLQAEARQPFDLARSPLWRILWVECGGNESLLAFTFHHSIMDEWSLRLLCQELISLYAAGGLEEAASLPELPVQYADYAVWQRERLTGEGLVAASNYWGNQLRDLPAHLELPADLPKPPRQSGRGGCHAFHLSGQVVARLNALSQEENATPFMTALAAYQVWLYRYTGQDDFVVATPITGRERPEIQNLLGFFLNTLPIRCQMEGGRSFREILHGVRQTVLNDFEHSAFPFEKIVELAVKERDANSQPLHQVMFVFVEGELTPLRLGMTKVQQIQMRTGTSKCDLTFSVMASEEGWNCKLEYASDRFTEEFSARMAGHLKEILEAIAEAPQIPVGQLRLMPDSERQQLLVEWNQTERLYPQDECLHQLFEKEVARSPDAVAVVFDGQNLSYRELNLQANRLARRLRALGVGPDVLIGLFTERSLEMIVALLGILKAGGAYVPLDPKLPRERLQLLLNDIKAPWLLCQRTWHERLLSCAGESCPEGQILVLEDLAESLDGTDSSDLPCGNSPLNLAYVMFTSGTTGQPKGVMVTHRGVVRLVIHPNYVKLEPDDVLLQYAPLSFDASTFEIWGSLLNGAKLVIPRSGLLDLTELGNLITEQRVTTLWLTAALFHQMMEQQPTALAGVRQLLAGGDVLSPSKVRAYLEMPEHGRLINGYGPTENTTFTCCCVFEEADQIVDSVSIGRPISGTCVYILGKHGEPVPVGVVGELYTGGDGLARGYLNAPELTQERFVADPFSFSPQACLYKTGDLARWRADGNIEFVGRADHQVKIRGYRIELGEVEHALRRCHGVADAAVVASETEPGDKTLRAYLVAAAEGAPSSAALRAELAKVIPDYMIPNRFGVLDQLPFGSNGKLDRKALAGLAGAELTPGREYVVARTELERRLVEIWQELLGKQQIGVHDNFFELGGHSLQAARLAVEIERLVGQKLPISALFQSPTIATLARRLSDEQWAPAWSSLVPLQPTGSKPPLFVVHGWGGDAYGFLGLAKHLAPEQPVYGVQAVGLDGSVPRHTTVEEMAAHYVEEIRSFQAEGPYHLCGYSLGGLITYEIAQQLRRQGQRVAVLILLDSAPTGPIPPVFQALNLMSRLPGRLLVHSGRFWRIPMEQRANYLRGRLHALRNLMVRNRSKPHILKLLDSEAGVVEMKNIPDYFHEVTKSYRLSSYSGSLDYFACEGSGFSTKLYWRFMARGRVRVHRVAGRHSEIVAPHNTHDLAMAVTNAIKRAGDGSKRQRHNEDSREDHRS